MKQLAGCETGPCPKVFHDEKADDYLFQGENVQQMDLTTIPTHERLVRVPGSVVRAAIANMQAGA